MSDKWEFCNHFINLASPEPPTKINAILVYPSLRPYRRNILQHQGHVSDPSYPHEACRAAGTCTCKSCRTAMLLMSPTQVEEVCQWQLWIASFTAYPQCFGPSTGDFASVVSGIHSLHRETQVYLFHSYHAWGFQRPMPLPSTGLQ